VTPATFLGRAPSFVEQKTDRRSTFKAQEERADLPGALIFLRSTISSQYSGQGIIVLKETNSVGAKQNKIPYFSHCRHRSIFSLRFTMLQEWLPLEVKDTSSVKLLINSTAFTDLPMAAQRHRDTFTAPISFTYDHDTESKSKLLRLASEAKAGTSKQRAAILKKPSNEIRVCLQSRKGLLMSCILVCWKSMDSRCIKNHIQNYK